MRNSSNVPAAAAAIVVAALAFLAGTTLLFRGNIHF